MTWLGVMLILNLIALYNIIHLIRFRLKLIIFDILYFLCLTLSIIHYLLHSNKMVHLSKLKYYYNNMSSLQQDTFSIATDTNTLANQILSNITCSSIRTVRYLNSVQNNLRECIINITKAHISHHKVSFHSNQHTGRCQKYCTLLIYQFFFYFLQNCSKFFLFFRN